MKLHRQILLFCLLALAGCKGLDEYEKPKTNQGWEVYQGGTFQLRHPPAVTAARQPGNDFVAHYFKSPTSDVMMGIYEGERPKTFAGKEHDLSLMRQTNTNRPFTRGEDSWGVDSKGKVWRESLWNIQRMVKPDHGKPMLIPSMLHIWYFGATDDEQQLFDSIIDSIEINSEGPLPETGPKQLQLNFGG